VHEVLVIRKDGVRLRAEEVIVPDAQQPHDDRDVVLERHAAEVLVHLERARQERLEVVHTQVERDGEAHRRPQRIAPADPVPELEHVGRIDAEPGHFLRVGRHGDEVLRDGSFISCRGQEPVPRRVRVCHRFLGRERLGRHQEQHSLRINELERLGQVGAVHVGYEVDAQAGLAVRLQRLAHHLRPQVGPADADVDDVGDGLARVALPLARPHGLAEDAHLRQDRVDFRHDVFSVHQDRSVRPVTQRDVQDGPVLRVVVLLAGEHGLDLLRQAGLPCQVHQQRHRLTGDAILGIVEQDAVDGPREAREALRVARKQIAHMDIRDRALVCLQRLPCRQINRSNHVLLLASCLRRYSGLRLCLSPEYRIGF